MISVSSRDARKELGLDFGGGGGRKDMEESELEEGEACSYQNHEDCDASIDPDVALSYIDEKIQDVLGHFQKDFEGGVSAENLGAKFGGYGSFLLAHQRSPVWSHPRTPVKVHGQNTPRSPNNLQSEGGKMDIVRSATATQSVRTGPSFASSLRLPAVKALSTDHGIKEEKCMKSTGAEAVASKYESLNIKSTNTLDQKALKVRIKMGTDSLSTQKNAEIYSGLGLVSPSSSLDGSLSESEGFDHDPQDVSFESPTSILQIMTSLPELLSPLPEDFLQLTAKETHAQDCISVPVHMDDLESCGMLRHESHFVNRDRKLLEGKKMKPAEGYGSSTEVKCGNNKNARIDSGVLLRKEQGIDALNTEELVSKTLKLPLLSSSLSYSEDCIKGMEGPCDKLKDANKGMVREKVLSVHAQKEQDLTSAEVNGFDEKVKGGPEREVVGDDDGRSIHDISIYTVKDNLHRDKICDPKISESSVPRGRTGLNIEQIEPPKKAYQRGSFDELDRMTLSVVKEHPLPGAKKSKGSHATITMEKEQEILRVGASSVPKTKKSSDVDSSTCKNETESVRGQMDHRKARDTYRDFFGELEEEDDRIDSLGNPSEDILKESEVVNGSTYAVNCSVKERSGVKKVGRLSTCEAYPKAGADLVQCTGSTPLMNANNVKGVPNMTAPTVVIQDNWVQCDKCHKWRLLPVGTNTDHLPEKWLCSMLNWLPDMNRCNISEEETTKAVAALYQGLALDGRSNLQNASGSVLTGGSLSTVQHPEEQWANHSLHAVPGGKKKFVKELSHSANRDVSSQLLSQKKNLPSSVKSRSLNDVNKSPAVSEPDVSGEIHKNKQKILKLNSDRGDIKNVKVKSRRDSDQDCGRPSKKGKTEGMHLTDEECIPDHSRTAGKVGHGSLPAISVGKGRSKHKDSSFSSDSKYEAKDRPQVSSERTKDKGRGSLNEGSLDLGNYDNIDGVKIRKLEEYQDAQTFSAGRHLQESRISLKEEYSKCRKEKKAKISKSEGRESSTSKGSGRTDKKVGHTKKQKLRQDPGSTLSQRSLDGLDCMKRDLVSMQACAAATSSSSKVSGSCKTKGSLQEVKGSPVESVSSSPMRILNADKSKNKQLIAKDDTQFSRAAGSPRICSDSEGDGGSDRSGTARKDKSFNITHHKSHGTSVLDFQDKNHISDTKTKEPTFPSPNVTNSHFTTDGVKTVGQYDTYPTMEQVKDQCQGEDGPDIYCANPSHPRKTGRESSSRFKDNIQSCKSEFDAEKFKNAGSLSHLEDQSPPSELKHKDGKVKLQEKCVSKAEKSENMNYGKKESAGNLSNKGHNEDNQLSNGGHGFQEVNVVAICKQEALSAPGQNQFLDCDAERSSKRYLSERIDQGALGKGKSLSVPLSGGAQSETTARCPPPVVSFNNGNGEMAVDPSKVDDASNMHKKQIRTADHQNGSQHISSRHPTHNGQRTKELDASSPIRKVSSSHAANNALKEAKNLKHLADRLKHSGSIPESTGLYFEAALKFLHGASLLESGNNENAKHNEMIQLKQVYSSTAKLCEFCAHEYERSKDMAGAALAYKCMEVAYLRVIYSSHTSASRDRHELQSALQMVPLGESPSSSASDVDNVNNSTTVDKIASSKDVSSPQVAGTHVITARNRPNFGQLLNFAQDVNFAMEASRKSRIALAAAYASLGEPKHADGFSSIKKALDFNFQDVDGLLRLVRLAMEALNR